MKVTPSPCGRTITLRCLAGACIEHRGQGAAEIGRGSRRAETVPCRRRAFVHVTSKCVAPTLAKASSIASASVCPCLFAVLSHAPPVFLFRIGNYSVLASGEAREAVAIWLRAFWRAPFYRVRSARRMVPRPLGRGPLIHRRPMFYLFLLFFCSGAATC